MARADISLTQGSQVEVPGNGSGSIAVNAQNLDFSGRSLLYAGALPGSVGTKAGDVVINATGLVHFTDSNKNYGYQLKAGQIFAITRLKPLQAGTLSGSVFPP